jgi:Immunity protein 26
MIRTYGEGDCFAVPLRQGGYGIGVIARLKPGKASKGRTILGYFFGPRYLAVPSIDKVKDLTASKAVLVCRFGDLGLHTGEWIYIDKLPSWNIADWPMPTFYRKQLVSGQTISVLYSEADPAKCIGESLVTVQENISKPMDGLYGAKAVESVMDELLPMLH